MVASSEGSGVFSGLGDGFSTLGRGTLNCGGICGISGVPTLGGGVRWVGRLGWMMGGNPGGGRIVGARVAVWSAKIAASCSSASLLLALTDARAVTGDGFLRARTRSLAAATAWLVELGTGMVTCTGSQASVSLTRSALVSHTQVR